MQVTVPAACTALRALHCLHAPACWYATAQSAHAPLSLFKKDTRGVRLACRALSFRMASTACSDALPCSMLPLATDPMPPYTDVARSRSRSPPYSDPPRSLPYVGPPRSLPCNDPLLSNSYSAPTRSRSAPYSEPLGSAPHNEPPPSRSPPNNEPCTEPRSPPYDDLGVGIPEWSGVVARDIWYGDATCR